MYNNNHILPIYADAARIEQRKEKKHRSICHLIIGLIFLSSILCGLKLSLNDAEEPFPTNKPMNHRQTLSVDIQTGPFPNSFNIILPADHIRLETKQVFDNLYFLHGDSRRSLKELGVHFDYPDFYETRHNQYFLQLLQKWPTDVLGVISADKLKFDLPQSPTSPIANKEHLNFHVFRGPSQQILHD